MQAAVIAYMLTVALVIPASGWLADRFGPRHVFGAAILLFCLGSLGCALAPSLPLLSAGRVVQGLGGALMMPIGRLIILRSYPRGELLSVLSFVTIPGLIGPLLGPTLGGWLVEFASWHWIFLINLPVGLLGFWATRRFLPDIAGSGRTPFDAPGFLLFGAAMVLVSLALEGLGELGLAHAKVMLLLITGLACLAGYWLHAAHCRTPLFSLRLFRIHRFAVGLIGNLFSRLGSGAMPFLTPLFLQVALGDSAFTAGMTMIPMAAAAIAAKTLATPLLTRLGYRRFLLANTLLLGAAIMCFAGIGPQTPKGLLYLLLACFGGLNSLQFTAMNTLTLIDLTPRHAGSGNSLLSVVVQLSMSLGVAAAAALLDGFAQEPLAAGASGLVAAFHTTYLCVGGLTLVAALIFLQLGPDETATTSPRKETTA
jgi:EmrB/QacA subfamily drug resistance transporter